MGKRSIIYIFEDLLKSLVNFFLWKKDNEMYSGVLGFSQSTST